MSDKDPVELELDLDPANPDPEPVAEPQPEHVSKPQPDADREELEVARREARENRERADKYERDLAELRQRREAPRDDERTREDARLNDAQTPDLEKWQIRANRSLLEGRNAANNALAQAEDVRDQTQFSQLAVTEPAMHKRYAARVEEDLLKARQQGFNVRREYLYNQLIAKDMRDGKFKKKAIPAKDEGSSTAVNRGKLPGARSDVRANSQARSEHEKRVERLRDQQI